MNALGRQILIDLYGCDADLLDDAEYIETHLREAAESAGATFVDATFHRFSPHGVTGVLTIQESHLAIHTWPEHGFAAVDLFTCGAEVDPWRACAAIKAALKARYDTAVELHRGRPPLGRGEDQ